MPRKGHSVVFAALLLVAQLLSAVVAGGAMVHDGMPGGDEGGAHCATHCSHDGPTGTGNPGCGSDCVMPGGGHCGTQASPALIATASIRSAILTGSFGGDRRSVFLPDFPLFDFLRPPTRD